MTIAVTAVSGQLGREIAKALLELNVNQPIIGLARTPKNAQDLGIEVRPGDYSEPEQLRASLEGVDTLLLVSGMDAPDARIPQHRNVIEAARQAGVQKIVYTSVQGPEVDAGFSPIVQSNRQTEADVRDSGLDWVIGRNGIYIEPDVAYIETYKELGEIINCADHGKCGYVTRPELAYAYAQLLTSDVNNGKTFNLHGEAITQAQLAEHLNAAFGTSLIYRASTVEAFRNRSVTELGDFIGNVVTGIYEGIRKGAFDNVSDYEDAAGRQHQSWENYFETVRQ